MDEGQRANAKRRRRSQLALSAPFERSDQDRQHGAAAPREEFIDRGPPTASTVRLALLARGSTVRHDAKSTIELMRSAAAFGASDPP